MNWEEPADPEKPPCPYVAGFKMAVTLHKPPPPFGGRTYPRGPPRDGYDKIRGYTQTRYCVKDLKPDEAPPFATSTNGAKQPSSPARGTLTPKTQSCENSPTPTPRPSLVIESVVRGSNKAGAQVVACHWYNDPSKTRYLAKIYDPLYYDFRSTDFGLPTDVVWNALHDYSVEAAAYEELKAYETRWAATATKMLQDESENITGCYPAYFGAFAFKPKVVVGGLTYTRTVPLLLTEYLHSPTMEQMLAIKDVTKPNGRFSHTVIEVPGTDDSRIHAFARAADSYLKLCMAGVAQCDFAPRNIILLGDLNSPTLRAVIIDFNVAKVSSRMRLPFKSHKRDPIQFCAFWLDNFQEWLPAWFFTNEDKRNSRLRIEFPSGEF